MMNILFVCKANVGRSQVAMELYRQKGGEAKSAGTEVDAPGTTLAQRPSAVTIVAIMKEEYGIDMIGNVRTQVSEANAKGFDKIIVMAQLDTVPAWLLHDERAEFWTIDDPKGQDVATTRRIVREVQQKIDTLL